MATSSKAHYPSNMYYSQQTNSIKWRSLVAAAECEPWLLLYYPISQFSSSTPLYQFLDHALSDPSNRTKFTLIYANVSPSDILLRTELDTLQNKYPKTFDIVYVVDKPVQGWTGPTGHIDKDLIKKHVPSKDLGEKVKVFICGKTTIRLSWRQNADDIFRSSWSGCVRCWPKGGHEAGSA